MLKMKNIIFESKCNSKGVVLSYGSFFFFFWVEKCIILDVYHSSNLAESLIALMESVFSFIKRIDV